MAQVCNLCAFVAELTSFEKIVDKNFEKSMVVRRRQSGFVLALVLVLLAIAGVVMVKAVNRTTQTSLFAARGQQELQQRWAHISLQRFAGRHADAILRTCATPERPWLGRVQVTLNDKPMQLAVADEQAKANLSTLWARTDAATAEQAARKLVENDGLYAAVALRPLLAAAGTSAFETFEQVFPTITPRQLIGEENRPGVADLITLWGDGTVNIQTAPLPVLRYALADLLTEEQISQLDSLRRERPGLSVREFLQEVKATREQSDKLTPLLADSSSCYSLFVMSEDGQSRRTHLYVYESTAGAKSANKTKVFSW